MVQPSYCNCQWSHKVIKGRSWEEEPVSDNKKLIYRSILISCNLRYSFYLALPLWKDRHIPIVLPVIIHTFRRGSLQIESDNSLRPPLPPNERLQISASWFTTLPREIKKPILQVPPSRCLNTIKFGSVSFKFGGQFSSLWWVRKTLTRSNIPSQTPAMSNLPGNMRVQVECSSTYGLKFL